MTKPSTTVPDSVSEDRRQANSETLAVAFASIGAVVAGVLGLWLFTVSAIRDNYRNYVTSLVQSVAQQLATMPATESEELLRSIQKSQPDIRAIQLLVPDGPSLRLLLDTRTGQEREADETQRALATPAQRADEKAAVERTVRQGYASVSDVPDLNADTGVSTLRGWAPVQTAEGQAAVVSVLVNADVHVARMAEAKRAALLGLVPSCLMVLVLCLGFRRIRMEGISLNRTLLAEQSRVRDSEHSFRSLFELSPLSISLSERKHGTFLQVNDALIGTTGYGRSELLTMEQPELAADLEQDHEIWPVAPGQSGQHYGPVERMLRRKDGSLFPALMTGINMIDQHGREVVWTFMQDISQRKLMEAELADAARHDRLTGLANRTLFLERLQQSIDAVSHGQQAYYAVLFLDFDRFKLVNDALGHAAGDELLRQISARLGHAVGLTVPAGGHDIPNLIARFGGDEFLVLLNNMPADRDILRLTDELNIALGQPYLIHGRDVYSTASIGIVTSEQCMVDAEAVVRNADVAMYEAKRAGRACAVIFDEKMHVRLTRHILIEEGLRRAIGTPQLTLVYQPVVSLDTGQTISVEALLRWNHPLMGEISPSEFIPIAEESGLISTIGEWVLQESCTMLAAWRIADPLEAPLAVSVNVSRAELALGDKLLRRVCDTLAAAGLPASCLQLEVTEREVMRDPEASQQLMHALRKLGVRLAMDDFGTGTSSLACLRDYPFDVIKIDRSFIREISTRADVMAVVHATLTLIANLGRETVAEGVEDEAQVSALQSLGCRYAQGYYFAKPQTRAQLGHALARANEFALQQPAA